MYTNKQKRKVAREILRRVKGSKNIISLSVFDNGNELIVLESRFKRKAYKKGYCLVGSYTYLPNGEYIELMDIEFEVFEF